MLVDGGLTHTQSLGDFAEGQPLGKMQQDNLTADGWEQIYDTQM